MAMHFHCSNLVWPLIRPSFATLTLVSSSVLDPIKPQIPLLVVLFRQSFQISSLRSYSPQSLSLISHWVLKSLYNITNPQMTSFIPAATRVSNPVCCGRFRSLINGNVLVTCFRLWSSSHTQKISPLLWEYESPRPFLLLITIVDNQIHNSRVSLFLAIISNGINLLWTL